jgi:hypothetical protein
MPGRVLRLLGWALFLVLLVATGLHFYPLVRQGVETSTRIQTALTLLGETRGALERDGPELRATLDGKLAEARGLGSVALAARRSDVRNRLAIEHAQRRPELKRRAAWLTGAGLAQDLERDLQIRMLETELGYLDALILRAERLTARHALLQRLYREQLASYERLRTEYALVCPPAEVRWYDLRFTRRQVELCSQYRNARATYGSERDRTAVLDLPALPDTADLIGTHLAAFAAEEAQLQRVLEANTLARHISGIRGKLPAAVSWLAAAIASSLLMILAVRTIFYFVIAPFVSRRAPVRLLPNLAATPLVPAGRISAVSQPVCVGPDEELLVHHRFLQSVATNAQLRTHWLLSWRYPISSIAARLVALTSIRTETRETFVISATDQDALSEIGLVDLPAGAAMVVQPRALIGVLQSRQRPLRITRHWRLFTLSAWLTLQLRYLVFHGPVRLLVQGSRGVRLETADAGRAISQAATLGFSADVAYSQIRTETFFPYLIGRQPLFNDHFAGARGVYLYEETTGFGPTSRAGGSRRLSGALDALLKIFGI